MLACPCHHNAANEDVSAVSAPVRDDARVSDGAEEASARDVVTHPERVTAIALAVGATGIAVAWLELGRAWAAGAAVAAALVAAVVYRLTPRQAFEYRDGVLHYYVDRRHEEWRIDGFVAADIASASRGADSLVLRRRDGRELLVPVTAEGTLAAAAPKLFQQGVTMTPRARALLESEGRGNSSSTAM